MRSRKAGCPCGASYTLARLTHSAAGTLAQARSNPLAPKTPHFEPKAKAVIFLFMVGAPSSMDMFDPKPALEKYAGQKLPDSYGKISSQFTEGNTPLYPSPWKFNRHGRSGLPVSTLYPNVAKCVDDICFVRSFYTESVVHAPAMYQVHTGRVLTGFPSIGSWVTYGLGSAADNLPAYVAMPQPEGTPDDWVARAYDDVPSRMWPVAKRSLLAHVARIEAGQS
jgi:hypothetical protein